MTLDFGINAGFVEELYAQYLENPDAVDPSWRSYFDARLAASAPRSMRGGPPSSRGAPPLTDGDLAAAFGPTYAPITTYEAHEREVLAEAAIQARVYKLLN